MFVTLEPGKFCLLLKKEIARNFDCQTTYPQADDRQAVCGGISLATGAFRVSICYLRILCFYFCSLLECHW